VIDAGVRMVDLDPEMFAWLNEKLAQRSRSGDEVSVLHDGLCVVQVAGPVGDVVAIGDAIDDPCALAERIAGACDAALVTVIDMRCLDAVSADLVELGKECRSQGELLWRARERWNREPGVVMVPAPEPSRWPPVQRLLDGVENGRWVVARMRQDTRPASVLAARVRDGLIVEVTSVTPPDEDVAVLLDASTDVIADVLDADDPLGALRAVIPRADVVHRGLEPLLIGS